MRPGRGGVAVTTVACLQALELSGLRAPATSADTALIAPGRCLVTDEISLAIAVEAASRPAR